LLIFLLNFFLIIVFVLIGVAFFTLIERKILGYIHLRIGPNKVGFMGIFQPFRDAIKLFRKEFMKVIKVNFFYYFFRPLSGLFFIILIFSIFPF
jgi:NADH-ubiquinone oxidoreductase chain 1